MTLEKLSDIFRLGHGDIEGIRFEIAPAIIESGAVPVLLGYGFNPLHDAGIALPSEPIEGYLCLQPGDIVRVAMPKERGAWPDASSYDSILEREWFQPAFLVERNGQQLTREDKHYTDFAAPASNRFLIDYRIASDRYDWLKRHGLQDRYEYYAQRRVEQLYYHDSEIEEAKSSVEHFLRSNKSKLQDGDSVEGLVDAAVRFGYLVANAERLRLIETRVLARAAKAKDATERRLKAVWRDELAEFAKARWAADRSLSNAKIARDFYQYKNPGNVTVRTIEAVLGKMRDGILKELGSGLA